ncbi:MAG: nuclear transport factor 2 family protein [Deltaproteobacteria bacterium]|nr:nuclear transport factor 2 family protein [Deltaproteobacteria bacterium]
MTAPRLAALALALLAAGCSPRRIPGTEIPATDDTTAIAAVVERYQAAAEARDAAGVLALVSPLYFDDAGTPDPADDLDFERLSRVLPADLARVSGVRMSLKLSDIKVNGDKAQVFVSYDARYRVTTRSGEVARAQQDVSRLALSREKGTWKIVSGL